MASLYLPAPTRSGNKVGPAPGSSSSSSVIVSKETINQTALREVEEETGISGLSIIKPLDITYHVFKRMDQFYIKITYWFKMHSDYEGVLIPQEKEGITDVKWISESKLTKVLNNSYANIKLLI